MTKEIPTSFPIDPRAVLHLPWQGSWQMRADRLRTPVDLVGAHLHLMTWETPGGWMLVQFKAGWPGALLLNISHPLGTPRAAENGILTPDSSGDSILPVDSGSQCPKGEQGAE